MVFAGRRGCPKYDAGGDWLPCPDERKPCGAKLLCLVANDRLFCVYAGSCEVRKSTEESLLVRRAARPGATWLAKAFVESSDD